MKEWLITLPTLKKNPQNQICFKFRNNEPNLALIKHYNVFCKQSVVHINSSIEYQFNFLQCSSRFSK